MYTFNFSHHYLYVYYLYYYNVAVLSINIPVAQFDPHVVMDIKTYLLKSFDIKHLIFFLTT